MKLHQLRYLCAVAREGFSVSAAAMALGTSQPAVSKQLRNLETEVGIDLLIRRGNRILGLTTAGEAIIDAAQRTLWEADNLRHITEEFTRKGPGRLVIATTHTYARFVLRPIIRDFMRAHPDVQLVLRQGMPSIIAQWVASGEADIGVSGRTQEMHENSLFLPTAQLRRTIFVPRRHPLTREKAVTLPMVARHPIITLDLAMEGGWAVLRTFEAAGLKPNVVLSALDADVVKSYVELGLGIAILLSVAYEPERDRGLSVVEADLFPSTTPQILLRYGKFLPGYMQDFIATLAPQWDARALDVAMRPMGEGARSTGTTIC